MAVAAVVLLAVPALALSGRLLGGFWLSNEGAAVEDGTLTRHERFILSVLREGVPSGEFPRDRRLARLGDDAEVRLLVKRDGRAFHVIRFVEKNAGANTARRTCYAAGSTNPSIDTRFDYIHCAPPSFPSEREPVLDMSFWAEGTVEDGFTLARLEGFAADAVKSVGLLAPDGTVHARTPVLDNVYTRADVPSGRFAGIAAFDAAGARIELGCQARIGHACVSKVGEPPRRSR